MTNLFSSEIIIPLVLLFSFTDIGIPVRVTGKPDDKVTQIRDSPPMQYHNGVLLTGQISINLIWYGQFAPTQRAIVTDFIASINKPSRVIADEPDVATWWKMMQMYYKMAKKPYSLKVSLGSQINDDKYSLGKKISDAQIKELAAKGGIKNAINVVLTSADVVVDGFCMRCGTHGVGVGSGTKSKYAYIWVGNPQTQCPGQCAFPFYQSMFGPKTQWDPPNKDVGMDGLIINLATQLAGTVTNPFGNGFFQGPKEAPLEAASACLGKFAKGSRPGFPGDLLVEVNTGADYNAQGVNGRKYLLPALFDPKGQTTDLDEGLQWSLQIS
ncbi:Protein EXORDIUM-like 1 [Euphorbia peplus]|nr:Protein EXORDIUM-like 1 [Euphorbia peplus]